MRIWLKRLAYVVGGLVGLAVIAAVSIYAISEHRLNKTYAVAEETIPVADDSATIARGEHIADAIAGCGDCHGPGLRGQAVFDSPRMGKLLALNLTTGDGGVGSTLTPALIERAVRHGVSPEGRALRIMPSADYQYMSDDDLRAIVAYVQHVAPVNNVQAPSHLMFPVRALFVFGLFPLLSAEDMAIAPAKPMNVPSGPTLAYGAYLARIGGCFGCHGETLSGGKVVGDPSWGPAANLTRAGDIGKWSEADFVQTLRTGKRPDGAALKDPMPWKIVGHMTDDELHAVWLYIQSVPPRPFGTH